MVAFFKDPDLVLPLQRRRNSCLPKELLPSQEAVCFMDLMS